MKAVEDMPLKLSSVLKILNSAMGVNLISGALCYWVPGKLWRSVSVSTELVATKKKRTINLLSQNASKQLECALCLL